MTMQYDIEQLKQIHILDIARDLGIEVKKNKAECFNGHDKKTRSLSFTPSKNLWHCFGCGEGGSNIEWIAFHAYQGEFARIFGPRRRGQSFEFDKLDNIEDDPEYHAYHLRCEHKYKQMLPDKYRTKNKSKAKKKKKRK